MSNSAQAKMMLKVLVSVSYALRNSVVVLHPVIVPVEVVAAVAVVVTGAITIAKAAAKVRVGVQIAKVP